MNSKSTYILSDIQDILYQILVQTSPILLTIISKLQTILTGTTK